MVRNVHSRVIAGPAEVVGALLDRLGSKDDPLWPSPAWPPMVLDRPLTVGADGGHDDIRYFVSAYEPGRRVEFQTHPVTKLDGFHAFEIEPLGANSCVLRHVLEVQPRGRMRLLMPLAIRWLHDAVVEELLDNAERAVTGSVSRPYRYTLWVRVLRSLSGPWARAVPLPSAGLTMSALARVDYSDAYSIAVPAGITADPREWADAMFTGPNAMPTIAVTEDEIMLGADGEHLDYRAGVIAAAGPDRTVAVVVSVVTLHSRAGRLYFAVIRRFHPLVVRALLRRGAGRLVNAAIAAKVTR